jgi:hypothetical protein
MFCAPEARLLVCRSPAHLGVFPTEGRPVFLSDCLTKELDQQSTLANNISD